MCVLECFWVFLCTFSYLNVLHLSECLKIRYSSCWSHRMTTKMTFFFWFYIFGKELKMSNYVKSCDSIAVILWLNSICGRCRVHGFFLFHLFLVREEEFRTFFMTIFGNFCFILLFWNNFQFFEQIGKLLFKDLKLFPFFFCSFKNLIQ